MAGTTITIEDAALQAWLRRSIQNLSHPADALAEIGEILVKSTQQRFETETDPSGARWAENSPATKARKARRSQHILTDYGHLGNTIRWQMAGAEAVLVGSNREYAAIHQFGGTIKHAARTSTLYFRQNQRTGQVGNRFVRRSRSNFAQTAAIGAYETQMVARPFLGISDEDRRDIEETLAAYLMPGA